MISLLEMIIFQIDLEIRAAPVPDNANMEINVSPLSEQSDNPDSHDYRNLSLFQFPLLLGPAPRRADPGNAVIDGAVNEESPSVDNGNVSLASISGMETALLRNYDKESFPGPSLGSCSRWIKQRFFPVWRR